MITGISVHDRVDWVFTITGMRRMASNTRPQRRGDGRQDPVGLLVDALHLRAEAAGETDIFHRHTKDGCDRLAQRGRHHGVWTSQ